MTHADLTAVTQAAALMTHRYQVWCSEVPWQRMAEVWKLPAAHGPSCWWPALWSAVYLPPRAHRSEAWSCPSPAERAEQPVRFTLAQPPSPTHPEWYLRLPPRGGSVVSLIMKMGHTQTPDDVDTVDSVVMSRSPTTEEIQLSAGLKLNLLPDETERDADFSVGSHALSSSSSHCPGSLLLHLLLSSSAALNQFEGLRPCRRAEQNGYDITEYLSNAALVSRPSDLFDNKSHEPKFQKIEGTAAHVRLQIMKSFIS